MRLIDANMLKEAVTTDYYEHFTRWHDTDQIALIDMVCDDIDESPTVDAVEVVRCRGCKSYDIKGFVPDAHKGWCMELKQVVKGDFFCAYGEQEAPEGERSRDTEKRSVLL